jgi:CobQ/CobB/MinD/ParA nucleotide binding domain
MKEKATSNNGSSGSTIHLSLQGKGGVGKSLITSILAQYLSNRGISVPCSDTDPVNRTPTRYQALDGQPVKLCRKGGIDQRGFDALIDAVLTSEGTFVVDTGASTFIPLWNHILENDVRNLLRQAAKRLRTRRNLNIQPTIIPIGYKFSVRVNRDILFDSPYDDATFSKP